MAFSLTVPRASFAAWLEMTGHEGLLDDRAMPGIIYLFQHTGPLQYAAPEYPVSNALPCRAQLRPTRSHAGLGFGNRCTP